MSLRGTIRALFSLEGLAFVLILGALVGGGLVVLGVIDIDRFGDDNIEAVEPSGDELVVELSEDHDFDALFIRHEVDDPVSEQPVVDIDLSGGGPMLDDSLPRFGGNLSYDLTGNPTNPGILCVSTAGFTELERIDFPSNEFVVAGVEGTTTDKEEIETVSIELDLDEYSCDG